MMGFLDRKWALKGCFPKKAAKNAPKKGRVGRPFSPKAGPMRSA
jgi:hypothetical protein